MVTSVSIPYSFLLFFRLFLKCSSLTFHCLASQPNCHLHQESLLLLFLHIRDEFHVCIPWSPLDHIKLCHLLPCSRFWGEGRDPDYLVYTAALVPSMGPGTRWVPVNICLATDSLSK